MKHMANEKDNAIEKMESLANKYEAVHGDIENLSSHKRNLVVLGMILKTSFCR